MTKLIWQPEQILTSKIADFQQTHPWVEVNDAFDVQLAELFRLDHVQLAPGSVEFNNELARFRQNYFDDTATNMVGSWFFYPWRANLVHILPEAEYRRVRSSRNRNLLTEEEQAQLGRASIGVAGLSVGSSILRALALTGYYQRLVIADADTLELSNLNRLPGSVTESGLPKVVMAARSVYELDPYACVEIYDQGLSKENVDQFVEGLSVAICAMDGLDMKVRLRLAARQAKIPVVMATDVENILLDIEPFHLEPERPIFHGNLSDEEIERMLEGELTKPEFIALAVRIIGLNDLTERLLESLPEIGHSLVSQPQLGSSAMMAGGVAAHVVHRIILGHPVPSGRVAVGLAAHLDPTYHESAATARRDQIKSDLRTRGAKRA